MSMHTEYDVENVVHLWRPSQVDVDECPCPIPLYSTNSIGFISAVQVKRYVLLP
jgi:hypothetical protein